jgi:uncharacterized protein YqhQ
MLSVTLLILQIVGLLTYPAVLASIFSGKNIVKYIADMKCDQTDQTDKATCEKVKSYKWEVLAVMIFYLVGIVFYIIAIYLEHKQSSKFPVFVLIGSICSLIGVALIVHMIFSISSEIKKDGGGNATKYLWFSSALTLVFSVIAAMLGGFKSINKLRK